MSNEQFKNIKSLFLKELAKELKYADLVEATGKVYMTLIAIISVKYPKMQAQTIYAILSKIRDEVWGI